MEGLGQSPMLEGWHSTDGPTDGARAAVDSILRPLVLSCLIAPMHWITMGTRRSVQQCAQCDALFAQSPSPVNSQGTRHK